MTIQVINKAATRARLMIVMAVFSSGVVASRAAGDHIVSLSPSTGGNESTSVQNQFDLVQNADGTYSAENAAFACVSQQTLTISKGMDIVYHDDKDPDPNSTKKVIQGEAKLQSYNDLKNHIDEIILAGSVTPVSVGDVFYTAPVSAALTADFLAGPSVFGRPDIIDMGYFGYQYTPSTFYLVASASPGGPEAVFAYDPSVLGLTLDNTNVNMILRAIPQSLAPLGSGTDVLLVGSHAVPEPSSLALLGAGAFALIGQRIRSQFRRATRSQP